MFDVEQIPLEVKQPAVYNAPKHPTPVAHINPLVQISPDELIFARDDKPSVHIDAAHTIPAAHIQPPDNTGEPVIDEAV